jgi:hypothetical protein
LVANRNHAAQLVPEPETQPTMRTFHWWSFTTELSSNPSSCSGKFTIHLKKLKKQELYGEAAYQSKKYRFVLSLIITIKN